MGGFLLRILFLLLILFSPVSAANENLVIDDVLNLSIPKGFSLMPKEMVLRKYPIEPITKTILTNPDGNVNIVIDYTQIKVPYKQEKVFLERLANGFKSDYQEADFHSNKIVEINGYKYTFVEFTVKGVHNVMLASIVKGRFLVINFNMAVDLKAKWLDKALKTVMSVEIISS